MSDSSYTPLLRFLLILHQLRGYFLYCIAIFAGRAEGHSKESRVFPQRLASPWQVRAAMKATKRLLRTCTHTHIHTRGLVGASARA